jgi:hypothetical protein
LKESFWIVFGSGGFEATLALQGTISGREQTAPLAIGSLYLLRSSIPFMNIMLAQAVGMRMMRAPWRGAQ